MIRRFSHIAMAVVLLFVTSGITIYQHYCLGHLVETNFFHPQDFCCDKGDKCCSNVQDTYQLNTDYLDFTSVFVFEEIELNIPVLICFDFSPVEIRFSQSIYPEVLHPPDNSTSLALLQAFLL